MSGSVGVPEKGHLPTRDRQRRLGRGLSRCKWFIVTIRGQGGLRAGPEQARLDALTVRDLGSGRERPQHQDFHTNLDHQFPHAPIHRQRIIE